MPYTDPRTNGFNYGRGWHGKKPPIYQAAMRIALELGKSATQAQERSWHMEMKLRDVRHAHTATEKALAMQRLEAALMPYLLPAPTNDN